MVDASQCDHNFAACKMMNDTNSVFGNCIKAIGMKLATAFAGDCDQDACYTGADTVCSSVKLMVEYCLFKKAQISCLAWQDATNCR